MTLGRWSNPLCYIGSIWLFATSCLLFLPIEGPVTYANMNWLCVVVAGVSAASAVNWLFNSRYHFVGPKRYDQQVVKAVPFGGKVIEEDDKATL